MSNVLFDMTGHTRHDLVRLLEIVCGNGWRAKGYAIRHADSGQEQNIVRMGVSTKPQDLHFLRNQKPERIVFFRSEPISKDYTPLPLSVGPKLIADLSMAWLEEADYGERPDWDGDVLQGYRAYCRNGGYVDDDPWAFLAISPTWIVVGK